MSSPEIDRLIQLLAKLPGFGPRSARRAALHLIKRKDTLLEPLAASMAQAAQSVRSCSVCGNLDATDPCSICADDRRDRSTICLVEDVADLWALERTVSYKGVYHVIGGTLSALDGRGPEDLNIASLLSRVAAGLGMVIVGVVVRVGAIVLGKVDAESLGKLLFDLRSIPGHLDIELMHQRQGVSPQALAHLPEILV